MKNLVNLENAIDRRLDMDITQGLLQSTVSAPASLTSPETHLGAISAIQDNVDKSKMQTLEAELAIEDADSLENNLSEKFN